MVKPFNNNETNSVRLLLQTVPWAGAAGGTSGTSGVSGGPLDLDMGSSSTSGQYVFKFDLGASV